MKSLTISSPNPSILSTPPEQMERNFRLGVINGVLYIFADALLDPTLVLVAFLSHLTSSAFLLGLIIPIRDGAWSLPQVFISGWVQSHPLKIEIYKRMSFMRIAAWGILALSINLVRDPKWMLAAFFFTYSISALASGVGGLPFLEVVSKTVPPRRRGELFAWRLGLGGLLGIGASVLVRWMVSPQAPVEFPHNFGWLSIGFFVIASISLLLFNGVNEMPDVNLPPRRSQREQLGKAFHLLRSNSNYQLLLWTQTLMTIANSATPFFAVFVQRELHGTQEWVGIYLAVLMASNLIANLVFGRLSRRVNNQMVMRMAAGAGVLMSLLVVLLAMLGKPLGISPQGASIILLPVFFLSGIRGTGFGVSSPSLMMNIAPESDRTLVIGFTQTLLGAVLLLTSVGGIIYGVFGFLTLTVITLGSHVAAWILVNRLVDVGAVSAIN